MKIRNEKGPNPPDIWLQNRLLQKRENRYGAQLLLSRQVFLLRKRAAALASVLVQQPFL